MLLQNEKIPTGYAPQEVKGAASASSIQLKSSGGHPEDFTFTFEIVRSNVFRTTVTSETRPVPPFPSAHKPSTDLAPKDVQVKTSEKSQSFTTSDVKAVVEWSNTPIVSLYVGQDDSVKPIHADLPFRSYAADGPGIAHYSSYKKHTLHVGLGEKAAPMDLAGRGFIISASDTFGYDAYRTDPLYKHIPLLINVKPYVLATHPAYKKLSEDGAFFKDPSTGKTAVTRLWSAGGGESGEGSHLDFTSNAGYQWWYDGVVGLKKVGIDVMWNDNNEYTVPDDEWQCALEKTDLVPIPEGLSRKDVGIWGRAIHSELMGKASHDATIEGKPEERPFVLTRSATAGTMKYCGASWSGDNVTAWESMRGGNSLALNASFSLLHCYGHDIGGFEGPQPTPEHLVRWIQLGVHSPRFAINCFKTSEADNLIGGVIEPWMYPTATPIIRATIKRRYELVPYTYSQNLRAHHTATPPQRWTGWGYEADSEVWTKAIKDGDTQFWFGDAFIIGGVYEPGVDTAKVYLPKKGDGSDFGFLNTNAPYEHFEAGKWHTVLSPWYNSIPVIAKIGSAVPVGKPLDTTSLKEADPEFPNQAKDDWRGVEIFPPLSLRGAAAQGSETKLGGEDVKGVVFEDSWYEDDGISREVPAEFKFTIRYEIVEQRISVEVKAVVTEGSKEKWSPLWLEKGVDVLLPVGEERTVIVSGAKAQEKSLDARGRRVWTVPVTL
ncbi:hypothetical protein SGCOL_011990 [Colletotrichum sp. CLE4]